MIFNPHMGERPTMEHNGFEFPHGHDIKEFKCAGYKNLLKISGTYR
jgi:hypothetical protein